LGAGHISCGSSEAEGWSIFAECTTCSRGDDGFVECAGLFFFVGHFRIAEFTGLSLGVRRIGSLSAECAGLTGRQAFLFCGGIIFGSLETTS
jgi:hypothetical protein